MNYIKLFLLCKHSHSWNNTSLIFNQELFWRKKNLNVQPSHSLNSDYWLHAIPQTLQMTIIHRGGGGGWTDQTCYRCLKEAHFRNDWLSKRDIHGQILPDNGNRPTYHLQTGGGDVNTDQNGQINNLFSDYQDWEDSTPDDQDWGNSTRWEFTSSNEGVQQLRDIIPNFTFSEDFPNSDFICGIIFLSFTKSISISEIIIESCLLAGTNPLLMRALVFTPDF